MNARRLCTALLGLFMCTAGAQKVETRPGQHPEQHTARHTSDRNDHREREHAQIEAQRQRVQAQAADYEQACYQKFAVNDCVATVRANRRLELARLRQREVALRDIEREEAAQKQRELIADQLAQQARRSKEMSEKELAASSRAASQPNAPGRSGDAASAPIPKPVARAQTPSRPQPRRAASVAADEQAFDRKLREAQAHKAEVLRKQAEQTGSAAKPLPTPP